MTRFSGVAVVGLAFLLVGCESMQPANYSSFADNTVALRGYQNAKLMVARIDDQSKLDPNCRLVGPIKASDDRPISQFIKDSFNDEFKFANTYAADSSATKLNVTLTAASFSSSSGLTSGWWDFTINIANSSNNKQLTVNSKYDFHSGFSAGVACLNTSAALTPAVQHLINKTVTDPGFAALIAP